MPMVEDRVLHHVGAKVWRHDAELLGVMQKSAIHEGICSKAHSDHAGGTSMQSLRCHECGLPISDEINDLVMATVIISSRNESKNRFPFHPSCLNKRKGKNNTEGAGLLITALLFGLGTLYLGYWAYHSSFLEGVGRWILFFGVLFITMHIMGLALDKFKEVE